MLIGLHGRKQAGKDTVHRRIEATFGPELRVERVAFADLLYQAAAESIGVTVADLQAWKMDEAVSLQVVRRLPTSEGAQRLSVAEKELSIREYLQFYGTEAHRRIMGDNFWVDAVDLTHEGRIKVVTDARFPNEAQAVRDAGGVVVRVVGPTEVEEAGDGHASEAPLPDELVDDVIFNAVRDDNFRSLDEQVLDLVERHAWGQP